MLVDIEKYVIQGWMDSGSIFPLLRHDYPDQPICKRNLYNMICQFWQKNNLRDVNTFKMIQQLLK